MPTTARFHIAGAGGDRVLGFSGDWTLATLPQPLADFEEKLRAAGRDSCHWDFTAIGRVDSLGAILIWRAWDRRWPERVTIDPATRHMLELVARCPAEPLAVAASSPLEPVVGVGSFFLRTLKNTIGMIRLFGQLLLDVRHLSLHPREIPFREFSATLYKGGAMALPVTALVGFLIGIVISYLSAIQLKNFGADLFIVNIIGIGIVREFGPIIVAVLVAGRSGSAMTAQIGVMRVTEEIDALATMGISRTTRLVLPRVLAMTLAVPLLVVWTSAAGVFGGMLAAQVQLDLSPDFFIDTLPKVVPIANVWIGLAKGVIFGFLISLIGCYFGLNVRPNTESLSAHTTTSVVVAITSVILADAVFAVMTRHIGLLPR